MVLTRCWQFVEPFGRPRPLAVAAVAVAAGSAAPFAVGSAPRGRHAPVRRGIAVKKGVNHGKKQAMLEPTSYI